MLDPNLLLFTSHDEPTAQDAGVVDAGLGASNDAAAPLSTVRPLACFARQRSGTPIAGALGRTWGSCCELLQMWVEPSHRRQGIGTRLVREFERRAEMRGCRTFYLETFSFQAPALYRALGYEAKVELRGFPNGITKYTLVRELPTRPASASPGAAMRSRVDTPIDSTMVTLRPITDETVIGVTRLSVTEGQTQFVAPNAVSLAQALFAPQAWHRAIYAAGELAGFIMLRDESLAVPPAQPRSVSGAHGRLPIPGPRHRQAALRQVIEQVPRACRHSSCLSCPVRAAQRRSTSASASATPAASTRESLSLNYRLWRMPSEILDLPDPEPNEVTMTAIAKPEGLQHEHH
jgi:GNAT superfamily N-acetyltransferase